MNQLFSSIKKILFTVLAISIVLSVLLIVYKLYNDNSSKTPPPPQTDSSPEENPTTKGDELNEIELHTIKYQEGTYGPDDERINYISGSMVLYVPRLEYEGKVLSVDIAELTEKYSAQGLSDVDIEYKLMEEMNLLLDNGVVMFNQSQLPGPENRNVSIAGHRDFKGMEFFYIDTLQEGDLIYLTYQGRTYVYEYEKTFVTTPTDWDPIAVSDKSKITLQSCDPVYAPNGDYDRIFVVANLIKILEVEGHSVSAESSTNTEDKTAMLDNWNH